MADLRDVKPGDTVFVVQQRRRHQTSPAATSEETVSRVGRKYGYLSGRFGDEEPFDKATGHSHHGNDSNVRANGYRFDVYHSREEYEREQYEQAEWVRLNERITGRWGGLVELSPDAVQAIHGVLDGEVG